ncbi:MAG TPA: hypothetical protein VK590_02780 [Saprospiraceae bacterium]|nr:hypothetical protein [Saprospiraceae bacterium]
MKNLTSATPIKTVYFNYNYSLCPYTDNSVAPAQTNIAPKGKLTLTGIYFTFGNSMKGKLSDYKFAYRHQGLLQGQPYKYGSKDFDRWGNYMPSMYNSNCTNPHLGDPVSNDEFPYAEQDSAKANLYAGTWSLNQIELPSGGTIKINYKAKHYAYVQDQPAMRLMDITGIKANGGTDLYGLPLSNYLKVYFKLENPAATRDELKRDYLRNIRLNEDYIYLKCYVKMNSGPVSNDKWEYVSLYSQISDYDVGVGNEYGYGYVKLNPLPISDDILNPTDLNPITKFSLQYMRENLPEIAYDQIPATQDPSNPVISVFQPLASMASQLVQFVHGFNKVMIARGYAKKIELDRSYIRLYKPDGVKYGGGSMVTKIEIKDNWGTMTNTPSADFSYGQIYDYMTSETQSDGSEREISSGVASYEPIIGGDENPLRIADVISERRRFAIDNVHYVEKPYGEVFMPAPQVVFSKITVRNLQYNNVKRTATGHTVMEYYTAKDFPVKTSRTDLLKRPRRINPLLGLLKIKLKEHMNASQGYAIETNNMHGQAKSSKVYDENGTRISGVFYHYKTNSSGELDNNVDVIHPDGRVTKGLLGVNYSLAGDARESKTRTISGGIALNLDAYMVTPVPVVVPLPWPNFEQSEERFRSMSFTKLINKFGVLESIEAYDLGSTITTNNLAYDAETGEVLLTRTYNEFNDPIYNLKIPAHLAYKGMQGAYKNIGFEASSSGNISNGVCSFSNTPASTKFFMPGDEVLLNGPLNIITKKAWVLYVDLISDKIYLIDIDGVPVGMGQSNLKIIRSGYRNMPTTQIGSITSMKNPIQANGYLEPIQKTQVLQADATEYSEKWQAYCGENMDACLGKPYTNPYTHNLLGEWRPLKSWLYLTERDRSPIASTSSSTNIRDNGFYLNFSSFWNRPLVSSNPANPQANLWSKDETDWIWSATATKINPNGTELESQNRLGLFSAEIVGYYNQLVTGVASNSRHRQIAFEGFEDFAYNGTLSPNQSCDFFRHFGEGFLSDTTSQTNHTGKYALKVPGNTSISTSNDIEENCPPGNTTTPINLPMGPYYRDKCNCIQSFSPDPGKYVITAWVKEDNGLGYRYYSDHSLSVITNSFSQSFKAKGMIIDGWQRIEAEFVIGPTDTNIRIMLEALGTKPVYFDDIRIFPFDGNMKNYVYDDISLKLLAELDANGYAKFYEYNQAGELIRIKQETERGIMTIQESRSSMPK